MNSQQESASSLAVPTRGNAGAKRRLSVGETLRGATLSGICAKRSRAGRNSWKTRVFVLARGELRYYARLGKNPRGVLGGITGAALVGAEGAARDVVGLRACSVVWLGVLGV